MAHLGGHPDGPGSPASDCSQTAQCERPVRPRPGLRKAVGHTARSVNDHDAAARYARGAAELLLALREGRPGSVPPGLESWTPGARADHLANEHLLQHLHAEHPTDAVLSEESDDDARRLDADRVWIVDPLDGTREFAVPGRTDWAVHVALWERGHGVRAAAVALPAEGAVFSTATVTPPPPRPGGPIRVVASRTRAPLAAHRVAAALAAELVPLGSAGAKAMAVVRGDADAYVHAGGQYEWDSAAPSAVALAAGLHASRLDGSALDYNQPVPWLPDLVICRPELAGAVLQAIAGD
jgi:3'(2'), 5'-bisphosphate nucleotidase